MQVLNLAPWGNVLLQLPPVRISGAQGWACLGTSLGDQWLKEIINNQVGPPWKLRWHCTFCQHRLRARNHMRLLVQSRL